MLFLSLSIYIYVCPIGCIYTCIPACVLLGEFIDCYWIVTGGHVLVCRNQKGEGQLARRCRGMRRCIGQAAAPAAIAKDHGASRHDAGR